MLMKGHLKTFGFEEKVINRIDLKKCPAGCKLDPLNKVLGIILIKKKHLQLIILN